jgi:hypothetical protein
MGKSINSIEAVDWPLLDPASEKQLRVELYGSGIATNSSDPSNQPQGIAAGDTPANNSNLSTGMLVVGAYIVPGVGGHANALSLYQTRSLHGDVRTQDQACP